MQSVQFIWSCHFRSVPLAILLNTPFDLLVVAVVRPKQEVKARRHFAVNIIKVTDPGSFCMHLFLIKR